MSEHDPDRKSVSRAALRTRWRWLATGLLVLCAAAFVGVRLMATDLGYASSASGSRWAVDGRRLSVPGSQPSLPLQRLVDRRGGRLMTVDFYSTALHRKAKYLVFLPAGSSPSHRLPVFYGLHGMPGRPLAFTVNANIELRLEHMVRSGRVAPMILVFPDGRIDGRIHSDSEWANTPSGRFESYVVDVVHDVDRRFATLPHRRERVIAGLSAGAYGAANVGLHQLALFGAIQVWSGYFTETRSGVFAHATPATMAYNSPIDYVRRLRHKLRRFPLHIFIYVGLDDADRGQTPPMVAALRTAGAGVHNAVYSGGHSWKLWSTHLDQMLSLAAYDFVHPPPSG